MTVLWAQELAQHGIRVAGVAPGFTATEMVVSLRDDIKEKFVKSIPIRRFAEPTEMSDGVLFILKNDYFTGRMLILTAGSGCDKSVQFNSKFTSLHYNNSDLGFQLAGH